MIGRLDSRRGPYPRLEFGPYLCVSTDMQKHAHRHAGEMTVATAGNVLNKMAAHDKKTALAAMPLEMEEAIYRYANNLWFVSL